MMLVNVTPITTDTDMIPGMDTTPMIEPPITPNMCIKVIHIPIDTINTNITEPTLTTGTIDTERIAIMSIVTTEIPILFIIGRVFIDDEKFMPCCFTNKKFWRIESKNKEIKRTNWGLEVARMPEMPPPGKKGRAE